MTSVFAGGGSMDGGGGGGLLFYRAAKSLEIGAKIIRQIQPQDLTSVLSNDLVVFYSAVRLKLIAETESSPVRLVPLRGENGESNVHTKTTSKADLVWTEYFRDRTILTAWPGIERLDQMVFTSLYLLLGHLPEINSHLKRAKQGFNQWPLFYPDADEKLIVERCESLIYGLWSYAKSKNFFGINMRNFTQEQNLSDEMFSQRVESVRQMVATTLKTLADSDFVDQFDVGELDFYRQFRRQLSGDLEAFQFDLWKSPVDGESFFYGKYAWNSADPGRTILISPSLQNSPLEELLFIVLHELGHSVTKTNGFLKSEELEQLLNTNAYALIKKIKKVNNEIRERLATE
jgi:hypothetical protein